MATGVQRTLFRGDSFSTLAQVFSQAPTNGPPATAFPYQTGAPPGPPLNVTGWSFWHTVKFESADADASAVVQCTTTSAAPNQVVLVTPSIGVIQWTFGPLVTQSLADGPTTLWYDVKGQDTSGNVWTVESGSYLVSPSYTRAV
jgi:hypothetical protein